MTEGSAAEIRVTLFDEARVSGPSGEVPLSPYQLALVAIVFASGGVTRPEIIRLLWRESPSSQARQRVRQLVHAINRKVGAKLFEAERDALRPAAHATSDIHELRGYEKRREFEAAARIVNRPFLPIVRAAVSDEFEDWCDRSHRHLTSRLERGARVAWSTAAQNQSWSIAREAAEALYVLDPSGDEAVESVIEARARVGRLRAAEVAYAEHLELRGRTGASPIATAAIERARLAMPEQVHDPARDRAPFVGRSEQLSQLASVASQVLSGESRYVLIDGEAGIGKTRLLEEASRLAQLDGIRVLRSRAMELERRITLNPILDALTAVDLERHLDALGEPWRAVIGATLPPGALSEPVLTPPPIDEKSLSRRLMDAFSLLLEGLANKQPTMLFLDDLHWADATTLEVLHFFRMRWAEVPFGLVATVRRPRPGAVDPLTQWVRGEEARPVARLTVEELTGAQSRELLLHITGPELDEGTTHQLLGLAADHPLYLTEIGRDFVAGRLSLPSSSTGDLTLPVSLREILSARWEQCSDEAIAVAQMLSVASRPIRVSELSEVVSHSLDTVVDAVEELIEWGLCESARDRVWISHDLFRASIYADLGGVRQSMLHGQFAEFLASREHLGSVGEIGIHFDRAGERVSATRYAQAAGERAMLQGAVAEAGHFYELVSRNANDPAVVAQATASYATAYHLGRDMHRANAALELASSRLRDAGDPALARRMDVRRVEGLAEVEGTTVEELLARTDRIKEESRAAQDWEAVALALDVELRLHNARDDLDGIRRVFQAFRQIATRGSDDASAVCHLGLAMGVLFDDPRQALAAAETALEITARAPTHRLKALWRYLVATQYQGLALTERAMSALTEARALAATSGDVRVRFSIESNLASALLDAGRFDQAETMLERSSELLGAADMAMNRLIQANNYAELALARGLYSDARGHYERAESYIGTTTPPDIVDTICCGIGLSAMQQGDLTEARRREADLGSPIRRWFCDPTTSLLFRTRTLELRRDHDQALDLLAHVADDIRDRLVVAWLKVSTLRSQKLVKWKRLDLGRAVAQEALVVAEGLELEAHAAQLRRLSQTPA